MKPTPWESEAPWSQNALFDPAVWRDEAFVEALALDLALGAVRSEDLWQTQAPEAQAAVRAELAAPAFQARVEAAEAWLAQTRDACEPWGQTEGDEAQDLAERILHEARREADWSALPEGWRGDWRLIRGFLNRRWQASWVVRLAAASLLAHLIALPAVAAYVLWVKPKVEPLIITWDLPAPEEVDEPMPGPEELPFAQGAEDLWSALGLEGDNVAARTRLTLEEAPTPPNWWAQDETLAAYWGWRLRGATGTAPVSEFVANSVDLGALLHLEAALDGWARSQADAAHAAGDADVRRALEAVQAWLAQRELPADPLADLAVHTLRRARALGWQPSASVVPAWEVVWADFALRRPVLADLVRPGAPLDGPWCALVREALVQSGEAWLDQAATWRSLWR